MSKAKRRARLASKVVGLAVMIAAVVSVFLIDWKTGVEAEPPPIRPLKTLIVGDVYAGAQWEYPAKVNASEEARLAFDVSGTIQQFLVKEGDEVTAGQALARLDARDYENAVKSAEAERNRSKAQLSRMEAAAKSNAVSKQEVSNAKAAFDKAEAELSIRRKALEGTEIKAAFDGMIAVTYVKQFETVRAKEPVLSLQNVARIEVKANIPESRVAHSNPEHREANRKHFKFSAEFDYFPGRRFPLTLKEFSTEADAMTQTYTATFLMDAPRDVTILPGMTAVVSEDEGNVKLKETRSGFLVPLDVVPVDGLGTYFVWILQELEGGIYQVARQDVTVGEMTGHQIVITSVVNKGDRIAAAGVHVLTEGQRVRLLSSDR